jgi:hypothetical protein
MVPGVHKRGVPALFQASSLTEMRGFLAKQQKVARIPRNLEALSVMSRRETGEASGMAGRD